MISGGGGREDAELHNFNRDVYLYDTTSKHHHALRLAKFNYLKNILRVNLKVGNVDLEAWKLSGYTPSILLSIRAVSSFIWCHVSFNLTKNKLSVV